MSAGYNQELVEQMVALGPPATRNRNDVLYPLVADGDTAAREEMIQSNMSLVIDKVDSYIQVYPQVAYLRDDLISEGFVGLTHAVNKMAETGPIERANPTGYMSYWIMEAIGRVVDSEAGTSASSRTQRRARSNNVALPEPVSGIEVQDRVVDPTTLLELRDLIDSCCESDEELAIVDLRAKRYSDREIAAQLGIPYTTTYMLRRGIYKRFLEKSGLKGEV